MDSTTPRITAAGLVGGWKSSAYNLTMTDFINADLAALMMRATTSARDVYAALPTKGYQRRQEVHLYEENEAGWPSNVRSSARATKDDGPLDWHSIIGTVKGKSTTYALYISNVPGLQELIDFVLGDDELAARISAMSTQAKDEEHQKERVAHDLLLLVRSVLNRAEALGDTADERLSDVYAELEPSILSNELNGDLLFPIALRKLDTDTEIYVSPDIVIEPLTRDVQLARAISVGGSSDVNPFLVAAATHAIVLKNQKFANAEGPLRRILSFYYAPPGMAAADLVCEALSIASGLDVGYSQVCLRPNGWADETWRLGLPAITDPATVTRYPRRLNEQGWNKQHDPISAEALERLPAIFLALESADRRAQLASRRLAQTSRRERADDVLIDACIGIEALLGKEHAELVHRMGLRAATALSAVGWKPTVAYEALKKIYAYRSTIVHGDEPKKTTVTIDGEEYSAHLTAVNLLRELLKAHVSAVPPWTPDSLDEDLHEALAERQVSRTAQSRATSGK
jgi:hypothetical protein